LQQGEDHAKSGEQGDESPLHMRLLQACAHDLSGVLSPECNPRRSAGSMNPAAS
jgi:hypothetical protein